ncbi:helix-turn-helix domain-containing protein [Psychrobacter sp. TAE2020]|uniref:helix-turn-helix domain-containing protein n=1 Tax=Psychrobacter sp. TAE2020 TaxID=2846762 RepID=UPI002B462453|nr:helix-turn-helix domain-containing protein [Psychrobacter sp. TAE2020]
MYEDSNKSPEVTSAIESVVPLHIHVERAVRQYLNALGDELPTDLYELILRQVELPLLTVVLEQSRGNQSKCAQILGLNRGTLRKKLKTYNLMS